ncbi:hypothetical protein [Streptomyces echinatus]|uniref:Uncharacterized protein n=2 Tax=Streptomyces echinatus TaxID=67293 RepID=A0A7W9PS35_9ACTN|nr:hypothetical protein [Streptomyces echinatus]
MKAIAGLAGKHDAVLLIRDADLVTSALRQALADTTPEERPGLERALALVESTAAATETQVRASWVRSQLSAVGFTGDIASIAALKALRRAEPRLSLIAAVQLQKDAVAHPE